MNIIKKKLEEILKTSNIKIEKIINGSCKNYIISHNNKKFFLKAYYNKFNNRFKEINNSKANLEIRKEWIKNKVNIPIPLKHFTINNIYFELYNYIENSKIELNKTNIVKICNNITKIHKTKINKKNEHFKNYIKNSKETTTIKNNINKLTFCYCHGDLNLKNIYQKNNKIYLRDFENIEYLPRIYDLANLILSIHLKKENSKKIIKTIIEEYNKKNNLNKFEKEIINEIIKLILKNQILAYTKQNKKNEAKDLMKTLIKLKKENLITSII